MSEPDEYGPNGLKRNTHLLDWLNDAYMHCKRGSRDWCEGYLHNARDVITAQDALIAKLKADLAFADEQSTKVEALLEPRIEWSTPPRTEGEGR